MRTKIIILGDLFPKTVKEIPSIPECDFCVANLECAIINNGKAISKDGPSLCVAENKIEILKKLGVNLVGLANNHSMDFGKDGIENTIKILKENNIAFAGCNLGDNSFIKDLNNIKVGFYFVSEHQYNIGVNTFDESRCLNEIKELKSKSDFVIVLFHGGKEYYKYPTPLQQLNCHKFIDSGADYVVCQHSHCVGCEETYKGAEIIYGQGNFIFPYSEKEGFKTGVILQLEIDENLVCKTTLLPTVHYDPEIIRYASDKEAQKILTEFDRCTKDLAEKTANVLYDKMIEECGLDFLYRLFNKGKLYVRLDTSRLFKHKMIKKYIRKNYKYILYLYNYFNCETHIEYIRAILSKQLEQRIK